MNPASWIPPDRYRLFHGLGASLPSMHGEESDLESECKRMISNIYRRVHSTGRMGWMAHQKWKEAKQLPGTAGPGNMLGCCLISFHFLWVIHPIRPVYVTLFLKDYMTPHSLKSLYLRVPYLTRISLSYSPLAFTVRPKKHK